MLCDTLASKLVAAGNTLAATICYICAGNIDKTVEIWSRSLTTEHEGRSYVDLLQVIFHLDSHVLLGHEVKYVFFFFLEREKEVKYVLLFGLGINGEDNCPCLGIWAEAV